MKRISCFILLLSIFIWGCNEDTDNNVVVPSQDSVLSTDGNIPEQETKMIYTLPSPVELYAFLSDGNATYNAKLLNSVDNKDKYHTTWLKAVNFGIYASDLAYSTVFNQSQETISYFKTTKTIADELNLTAGFNKAIAERFDANITNCDSLFIITNESYWDAIKYLEENDNSKILPFIIFGGWLEALYLSANSVTNYKNNDVIVEKVLEQQVLIENLVDMIKTYEKTKQLVIIVREIKYISNCYSKLQDENMEIVITEKSFKEFREKISKVRNKFVK